MARQRITVSVSADCTVTVAGTGLDLAGYIAALEATLGKARKAKQLRVTLPTYLQMLADQARNDGVISS